jgi:hypothetical protein
MVVLVLGLVKLFGTIVVPILRHYIMLKGKKYPERVIDTKNPHAF